MSSEAKRLMESAPETFEMEDGKGRLIKIRKPNALKRFRFIGMLGKAADSDRYMSMVAPLIYLYAIDEDTEIPLSTPREMEALIQRLGDDGLDALNQLVVEHFGEQEDASKEQDKIKE